MLRGVLHRPPSPGSTLGAILCHGMESNKESMKLVALSRHLADSGIWALRFDFSCAGESTGSFENITYSGETDDLESAYRFLVSHSVEKVAILGSSMGGSVALLFAARDRNVAALVTIAAPFRPREILHRMLPAEEIRCWREHGAIPYHGRKINVTFLEDLDRVDLEGASGKIRCPVLVIHGDCDNTVPVEEARELYRNLSAPKKLCILRGADHRLSDPAIQDEAVQESLSWITTHLL